MGNTGERRWGIQGREGGEYRGRRWGIKGSKDELGGGEGEGGVRGGKMKGGKKEDLRRNRTESARIV